jgi:phosphate transport system permease protein
VATTENTTQSGSEASRAALLHRFTPTVARERLIELTLFGCALLSIVTTLGIVYVLFVESIYDPFGRAPDPVVLTADGQIDWSKRHNVGPFFQEISPVEFFTSTRWTPQFSEKKFGVLPLMSGTLIVAVIATIVGLPIGLLSAVYLSEYATPRVRQIVKPTLEILAGIPTVVFGYFGLAFITPYLIKPVFHELLGLDVEGYNALSGGIVVGLMIIPVISSLSEDALRAVPRTLREAGYALGSTKFDVSVRVVLPAAFSGVVAAFLLALARAIGETMAVTIACGQSSEMNFNPLMSIQTMTSFIVNISLGDTPTGSIEYKSLYAVAMCLFCVTLVMNIVSQFVMRRFREVYQ